MHLKEILISVVFEVINIDFSFLLGYHRHLLRLLINLMLDRAPFHTFFFHKEEKK